MWTVPSISNGTKYYSCTQATSSFHLPPNHCAHPSVLWHFSFTPDGKTDVIKDCVHISEILPWIMRLISIPNWFKWLGFFFFFVIPEQPNKVSMCRMTRTKEMADHSLHYNWFRVATSAWLGRSQEAAESRKKGKVEPLNLLTSNWNQRSLAVQMDCLRPGIFFFFRL